MYLSSINKTGAAFDALNRGTSFLKPMKTYDLHHQGERDHRGIETVDPAGTTTVEKVTYGAAHVLKNQFSPKD